jgi:uncharacterized protein YbjT (DUF2867 family)
MKKSISVIITGATGDAGSGVLAACMKDPRVQKITTITRKSLPIKHNKIVQVIHNDFLNYSKIENQLKGHDACYWCLGISQSKVRKEEDYTRIIYGFTMAAAKVLEKLNPGMTFCFLSGMGTKPEGRMLWARVKGKAEVDLGKFNFNLYNFRPGFIHPIKGRKSHYLSARILYLFIKNSKKMCVEAEDFGQAMINATLFGYEKHTLENINIRELANMKKQ